MPVILALEERTMFLVNPEESGGYERDSLLARLTGLLAADRPAVYGRGIVLYLGQFGLSARVSQVKVLIVRSAQKEIERLPDDVLPRVRQRILSLGDDPLPKDAKKLSDSGNYRLRVRDYRIIYAVDSTADTVEIKRVRHRREVYCRRA